MSDGSDYKSKIRNKKGTCREKKQDPIKLSAKLLEKLLTTAYKSKVLKFKLDEDPLHHHIHFVTFMESLEMMFLQYKETCKVLPDYQTIGVEDIKYYVKKAIRNLLNENIDVYSRRLIAKFSVDGVKYISKLQSHCANMNFSDKIRYDRIFQKFTHKGGE